MRLIMSAVALVAASGFGATSYWWAGGDRGRILRLPGTVEVQEVRLASKVGGRVAEVFVAEGTVVESGRRLLRLDAPELSARRDRAAARLRLAEADLRKARAGPRPEEKAASRASVASSRARLCRIRAGARPEEVEHARHEFGAVEAELRAAQRCWERTTRLGSKGFATVEGLDADRTNLDRLHERAAAAAARLRLLLAGSRTEEVAEAEADLARAQAEEELLRTGTREEDLSASLERVAEARAELREAELALSETVVIVPETAQVEVLAVRTGDVVTPNQPVARVLRAEDLWVRVFVPETELGRLRLGQDVAILVDSHPRLPFRGTVTQIASASEFTPRNVQSVDERRHQVFGVKVRVAEPMGVFKAGMSAEIEVPLQSPTP